MGAQNVLVSLAEKGAVLCSSDGHVYESDAPKGVAENSVGAGDSMVAGFLADWIVNKNFESALKNGILSGSASTFSGELATKDSINKILSEWK
jgi:1-phosphofructokinase